MTNNDQAAKETIINVVKEMIQEETDISSLTVRQIADRAGVGIGLINYYFKSKNNLVSSVVGEMMAVMASEYFRQESSSDLDPAAKLKTMLKEMYAFGQKYEKYVNYLITHTLLEGDMGASLMLIPKLKDIFPSKNEFELRTISLQILLPIQVTSLNPGSFRLYSGVDLRDVSQRDKFIDTLVDNVLAADPL